MITTGLLSVTFRKLTPPEIVGLVRQAGLAGIEWGGDIHVPHGNLDRAREVRQMTLDAGITIAAYGSSLTEKPFSSLPYTRSVTGPRPSGWGRQRRVPSSSGG